MNDAFKRDIIIDHYKYPRNKHPEISQDYLMKHNASTSCIDDFKVWVKFEGQTIKDLCFDGIGCAISTAATSIFTTMLKDKNTKEALKIIDNYINMLEEKPYDQDLLQELIAFDNLHKQASRIKCGLIGVHTIRELIEEYGK